MSPESVQDLIKELLGRKGLKITPQRLIIAEYLLGSRMHPTADEIYQAVQDRLPACSRATLYNTLNTLVEASVINAVSTEPGRVRYDANIHPHHHFVDIHTGRIHDIPWDRVSSLCQELGKEFNILDYQITFYGEYFPDD